MFDKQNIIKAWECCKNPFDRICEKCPFEKECCHDGIPDFVVAKAIELLKEQEKQKFFVDENGKITPLPVVVRCKDCKNQDPDRFNDGSNRYVCRKGHGWKPDDWYCADGERR